MLGKIFIVLVVGGTAYSWLTAVYTAEVVTILFPTILTMIVRDHDRIFTSVKNSEYTSNIIYTLLIHLLMQKRYCSSVGSRQWHFYTYTIWRWHLCFCASVKITR